ncbi:TPA: hypothetical protein NJ339_004383 [Vibrio parahaemolyticus]|uniref:hypothetical protein n=1 Tax=Vibrio parahaemolyticus TaxID=670 RepID=UPI00065DC5BB|nr:hypothetical protein [Vibrio parahaemolyticus]TOE71549.1 hypothetical protein CGJ36_23185 [Vibrio parahaemolyticus]HCG6612415.1 hypothetical protein [Vibrio parahaemolyticus]HCG7078793.1 hypothetical protein [Vibrio parahaemolyticus]
MAKSVKEAWKHFKNDSTSIWSILWGAANFVWLCYFTFQINGAEKTAELIATKIFIGLLPFLLSSTLLFVYHYLRSDLYLEQAKPQLGKTLIPGRLLKMVEHWKPEPIVGLGNSNVQYNAYRKLLQYRSSYEFDHIHSQIDEFIKAFEVGGTIVTPEIRTSFSTKEEAEKAFPRLKTLAKQIGSEIT